MGWAMLLLAATIGAGAMWLFRFPRPLWAFGAAALMLGAAGYALQGEPGLAGSPVAKRAAGRTTDPELVALRQAMFGRFGPDAGSFVAGDALGRAGATSSAVSVYLGGIRANPESQGLWTGLGEAIVEHDGGNLSPAARLAFDRAIGIDPRNPGPWFFYGLAHVRAGDLDGARARWAKALELTPADARYREDIALRLLLLDRFMEMREQRPMR